MVVDISELDAGGQYPCVQPKSQVVSKLPSTSSCVTKKFFGEFDVQRLVFVEHIQGISDDQPAPLGTPPS